jgi:hypothetical protein
MRHRSYFFSNIKRRDLIVVAISRPAVGGGSGIEKICFNARAAKYYSALIL